MAGLSQGPMILSYGALFHLLSILIKHSVNSVTGSREGCWSKAMEDDKAVFFAVAFFRFKAELKVKDIQSSR